MNYGSSIKRAALAAVAACGLAAVIPQSAAGGDFHIGINIGGNDHHRDRERTTVVYEYDSYCVGPRRALYDADWRLRQAQVDEWRAYEALDAARHREGELAVVVDDHETLVADFDARGARGGAAVEDARIRLGAFERRMASARADVEASHVLHDADGAADAESRLRRNEAGAAEAARELRAAEDEAARFPNRERVLEIKARMPREREDLVAAQDEVFNCQRRVDECVHRVAFCLHDRDEALWLVYRDEIMTGRAEFAVSGFRLDVYGGRMPRDREIVHERLVRPADYWLAHPAEMHARIVEVDDIAEIHHMHDIQRKHERTYAEVERVELATPVERRRVYVVEAAGERDRMAAAKAEREAAAREHRPVRITAEERAVAIKNRADANAEKREARADARAEDIKARADARSEVTKARADARSEQIRSNADAKSELTKARADAKAEETKARADANAQKKEARTDARDEKLKAQADAKAKQAETHEEKAKAQADAKTQQEQARAAKQQEEQAKRDAAKAQREARNNKNDKNDKEDKKDQASTDPNSR